jgi:flagellar biogenesis protein FliO
MHRPPDGHRSPCSARALRRGRAALSLAAGLLATGLAARPCLADGKEQAAPPRDHADARPVRADRPDPPRLAWLRNDRAGTSSAQAGASWMGAACLALVLAAGGAVAIAARRLGPRAAGGAIQVAGRVSLSPRHSVYLLRVGRRVLVVGAGPDGPPALITELDELSPDPPADLTEARS